MNYMVIGGSKGIGLAITEQLLAGGHSVWVGSRHKGETPTGAFWFAYDALTDDLPVEAVAEPLAGFVYTPGTMVLKPFRSLSMSQFSEDFAINVLGAARSIQSALPALKKSENASVVLFSTVAVGQGMPFHASIAASKGAVEGLTRSLAAELAPAIRVNAIAPSLTDTPLAERLLNTEDKKAAAAQRNPLRRVGQASDIAAMTCFLLDPSNNWISGQIFPVDGGMGVLRV
ncbi:MAG: SDR family oxidoreductase [Saprospiraceae bacterium]|nr:SDR family oxidoreductase [Saprospiraceae bacterium]